MQTISPPNQRKKFEVNDNSDPLSNKDFKIIKPSPATSSSTSPDKSGTQVNKSLDDDKSKKKPSASWVAALAMVKFDIDQGNVLESIYPIDILSTSEQKTLSFLAFPDSNAFGSEGALKYIFKFQKESKNNHKFDSLFGYTYFRQRRDPTNPRGFSQKSLVILTIFPFIEFFKDIIENLGSSYFETPNMDEAETLNFLKKNYEFMVNSWQKPLPNSSNEVNICGKKFTINIPKNIYESRHIDTKNNLGEDISTEEKKEINDVSLEEDLSSDEIEGSPTGKSTEKTEEKQRNSLSNILSDFHFQERGLFQDINLYKLLHGPRMASLWKVWELVLTNQPLMIMSDSPAESSEAVLGMISLISPLEYQGDYKPYLTIYDPCYKQMQEMYDKKVVKSIIIGVTNPLFLKTMQNYPSILHLEQDYLQEQLQKSPSKKPILLKTSNKLTTQPDPNLKKMLIMTSTEEASAINNALLRKSVRSLTESFLSVFHTYFKLQVNDIKKFEEKDFLRFLELQKFSFKAQFPSQSDIIKVYAKFLKSANFLEYIKSFPNVYFVKNIYK